MADLSITASSVLAGADAVIEHGTAGASVTAGQVVYRDPADSKLKLADNNDASANVRKARGIALHAAASGQPLAIIKSGSLVIGAAISKGATYYLSDTPGGICPFADLATGEYPTSIGQAKSASTLAVRIALADSAL